jgi:hypothetical protein
MLRLTGIVLLCLVAQDIDGLVKQLGSDSTRERDTAQDKLRELVWDTGHAATIRAARKAARDPEVRDRLTSVLSSSKKLPDSGLKARFIGFDPVHDGRLVVWGGCFTSGDRNDHYMDGAILDPETLRWKPMARCPLKPREYPETKWVGKDLFVWGGEKKTDGAIYDIGRNAWTVLPDAPCTARRQAWVRGNDRVIFIFGGEEGDKRLSDGAAYDRRSTKWVRMPENPRGLSQGIVALAGDRLLVWGDDPDDPASEIGTVFDPATGKWSSVRHLPWRNRTSYTTVWLGTKLMHWGGAVGSTRKSDGLLYDPSTDRWTRVPPAPIKFVTHGWIEPCGNGFLVRDGAPAKGSSGYGAIYYPREERWSAIPEPEHHGDSIPGVVGFLRYEGVVLYESERWVCYDYPADRRPRRNAQIQRFGDLLVIWGGLFDPGRGRDTVMLNDGLVFDLKSHRWIPIGRDLLSLRVNVNLLVSERRLIVWGGGLVDVNDWFRGGWLPARDGACYLLDIE